MYTQPQAIPQPVSSTSSTSNEDAPLSQPSTLSRRNTRKAVPAIDGAVSPTSSTGHDSGADSQPPINGSVNGHRAAQVFDDSKLPASPSPVRRATVVDGHGHPVKLDTSTSTSEGSLRVMSADRKSFHPKAESGYVSRSASRSPAPALPPQPTISPGDADEMRRLLAVATSADECRLVVDLFLVRSGFPLKDPASASAAPGEGGEGEKGAGDVAKKLEDAIATRAAEEAETERGLVALFLGGDDATGLMSSRCSSSQSRQAESDQPQPQHLHDGSNADGSPAPAPAPSASPAPWPAPASEPEPEPEPERESEPGREGERGPEELEQQQQNFRAPSAVSSSH